MRQEEFYAFKRAIIKKSDEKFSKISPICHRDGSYIPYNQLVLSINNALVKLFSNLDLCFC